ncbi:MAG: carboxypeptidase-like regulatory domain-containing protein [Deltaproteobacteria bacterium]|nr:carboxypeptidase-like regulatory domain-containing protein [Deltaproteobacteria bacterium]
MRIDSFFKSSLLLATFLAFFVASGAWAGSGVTITGILLERGTRAPLPSVNIYILPEKIKAVTDQDGKFTVENVPEGPFNWVVNLAGYEKLDKKDVAGADGKPRQLYLEKSSYQVYETTIYGKAKNRDDSARTLRASEFLTVPGARGDPVKAVQNLPGVARANGFSSQVIIEGSAPQDTRYWIDGHEVPIIFHFGGLTSVLIPESIDRVEYLAAGYGPEYGRALGGQVGVWTRSPKKNRLQGFGFVDIFNSGGLLEGPVGEYGSFMVSARQSYIGAVLRRALKNNSSLNLTVAPQFSDTTMMYETELTPRDHFKVVGVGSRDQLEFLFTQPVKQDPSIRGNFDNITAFYRLIPQLTHKHSETTTSRYSLGFGRDWVRFDAGSDYFYLNEYVLSGRAELEQQLTPFWKSYAGFDSRYTWSNVDLRIPSFNNAGGIGNPISTGTLMAAHVYKRADQLGLYLRNVLHDQESRWTLLPGARIDYYNDTNELLPVPRLGLRYDVDEYFNVRLAGGMYTQRPSDQETDSTFGNPDVKSSRATHVALSAEKDFREGSSDGFVVSGGPFYKYLYNLVVPSSNLVVRNGATVPLNFANTGSGRVLGGETLVKMNFKPWTGWLSYTLSRSTRTDQNGTDYLFRYDQTHVLTAIASVDLPRNWKISGRFRYSTGNPVTPVTSGTFDADADVYVANRGPFYSDRLAAFYQLDLRFDKKWIYDKWILSFYLDVQNVTNHQNPELIRYAYDFQSKTTVNDLPILPTFGIKGEF